MQTNAYVFYVNLNHVFLLCDDVTKSKKVSSKKPKAARHQNSKRTQKRPSRGQKKKKETSLSHISSNLEIISLFTSLSLFLSSRGPHLRKLSRRGKKVLLCSKSASLFTHHSLFFSHQRDLKTERSGARDGFRIGSD